MRAGKAEDAVSYFSNIRRRSLEHTIQRLHPPAEPIGPGARVIVGPVQTIVSRIGTELGIPIQAPQDATDGNEGPGVVEATDWPFARILLDDGRTVRGIRIHRLTREKREGEP